MEGKEKQGTDAGRDANHADSSWRLRRGLHLRSRPGRMHVPHWKIVLPPKSRAFEVCAGRCCVKRGSAYFALFLGFVTCLQGVSSKGIRMSCACELRMRRILLVKISTLSLAPGVALDEWFCSWSGLGVLWVVILLELLCSVLHRLGPRWQKDSLLGGQTDSLLRLEHPRLGNS